MAQHSTAQHSTTTACDTKKQCMRPITSFADHSCLRGILCNVPKQLVVLAALVVLHAVRHTLKQHHPSPTNCSGCCRCCPSWKLMIAELLADRTFHRQQPFNPPDPIQPQPQPQPIGGIDPASQQEHQSSSTAAHCCTCFQL